MVHAVLEKILTYNDPKRLNRDEIDAWLAQLQILKKSPEISDALREKISSLITALEQYRPIILQLAKPKPRPSVLTAAKKSLRYIHSTVEIILQQLPQQARQRWNPFSKKEEVKQKKKPSSWTWRKEPEPEVKEKAQDTNVSWFVLIHKDGARAMGFHAVPDAKGFISFEGALGHYHFKPASSRDSWQDAQDFQIWLTPGDYSKEKISESVKVTSYVKDYIKETKIVDFRNARLGRQTFLFASVSRKHFMRETLVVSLEASRNRRFATDRILVRKDDSHFS